MVQTQQFIVEHLDELVTTQKDVNLNYQVVKFINFVKILFF